jgi:hypothetical protein
MHPYSAFRANISMDNRREHGYFSKKALLLLLVHNAAAAADDGRM